MKMETSAEYMGTVMNELIVVRILSARDLNRKRNERNLEVGGPECPRRRKLGSSP